MSDEFAVLIKQLRELTMDRMLFAEGTGVVFTITVDEHPTTHARVYWFDSGEGGYGADTPNEMAEFAIRYSRVWDNVAIEAAP